jgi:hypothetical protein
MTVDMQAFEDALALLDLDAELDNADRVEAWLHDPTRTAHRLVSVPTAVLMAQAVGGTTIAAPAETLLPGRAWRILPDRLLALHPRRGDRLERLRIPVAGHLHLTATVLEEWGWAKSGQRIRTTSGRRCILGAQRVVHALGYGTEHTAAEAGRQIQGALAERGITMPYPRWNELPGVTGPDALALVREAAKGA